ncbi:DUF6530 family protein [Mycoplasma sp. P36-A1]|uniref:DUF6530 family protein n=1 Tax=Mycoplasma sp. P36-A1 TaxID=3252900 RepID=UPI003C2F17BA
MKKDINYIIKNKNYNKIDGKDYLDSDIESLSIGYVERNGLLDGDIAVEFQDNESKILTATQALDSAITLLQTSLYFQDAYKFKSLYDKDNPTAGLIGVQGGRLTFDIDLDNPNIERDLNSFYNTLQQNGEILGERYKIIARLLKELGY